MEKEEEVRDKEAGKGERERGGLKKVEGGSGVSLTGSSSHDRCEDKEVDA